MQFLRNFRNDDFDSANYLKRSADDNSYAIVQKEFFPVVSSVTYTLNTLTSAVSAAANNANLSVNKLLAVNNADLTAGLNSSVLQIAKSLTANASSFSLTAGNAGLDKSSKLAASSVNFGLTRNNANLVKASKIAANFSSFGTAFNTANLIGNKVLIVSNSSSAVAAANTVLRKTSLFTANPTNAVLSPKNANLTASRKLQTGLINLDSVFYEAGLNLQQNLNHYILNCEALNFPVNSINASFKINRKIQTGSVNFSADSLPVQSIISRQLSAENSEMNLAMQSGNLFAERKLNTESAIYQALAADANLTVNRKFSVTSRSLNFALRAAMLNKFRYVKINRIHILSLSSGISTADFSRSKTVVNIESGKRKVI